MKRVFVGLGVIVVVLGVLLGVKLYKRAQAADAPVGGTGTVEGVEIDVVAKVGARITKVLVEEGALVKANQPLVELDCAEIKAARDEAAARLAMAQAQVSAAEAAVLVASATASAAKASARASRATAKSAGLLAAAADAVAKAAREAASGASSQTRSAVEAEKAASAQAAALRAETGVAVRNRARVEKLAQRSVATETDLDLAQGRADALGHQVEAALANASSAKDRSGAALSSERATRAQAEAARAQAHGSAAQGEAAKAAAKGASAQAEGAQAQRGAAIANLEAAKKAVEAGRAAVQRADITLAECTLRAPRDAIVQTRAFEPGEMALPGGRLLTLLDLSDARLTFYLANADLGHAKPGGAVEVVADAYPGETFAGRILSISPKAEFTPRNIQTREDRDRLVYAVKVAIPNPALKLRSGMPVEVRLPGTRRGH